MIFHITPRLEFERAQKIGHYTTESLTSEGFIHCSTLKQVTATALRHFKGVPGLIILEIDEAELKAELLFEGGAEKFPHIYGPLNLDAVVATHDFPANPDGTFELPLTLQTLH